MRPPLVVHTNKDIDGNSLKGLAETLPRQVAPDTDSFAVLDLIGLPVLSVDERLLRRLSGSEDDLACTRLDLNQFRTEVLRKDLYGHFSLRCFKVM